MTNIHVGAFRFIIVSWSCRSFHDGSSRNRFVSFLSMGKMSSNSRPTACSKIVQQLFKLRQTVVQKSCKRLPTFQRGFQQYPKHDSNVIESRPAASHMSPKNRPTGIQHKGSICRNVISVGGDECVRANAQQPLIRIARFIDRSVDRPVDRSVDRSVAWSIGCLVAWSLGRSLGRREERWEGSEERKEG